MLQEVARGHQPNYYDNRSTSRQNYKQSIWKLMSPPFSSFFLKAYHSLVCVDDVQIKR